MSNAEAIFATYEAATKAAQLEMRELDYEHGAIERYLSELRRRTGQAR